MPDLIQLLLHRMILVGMSALILWALATLVLVLHETCRVSSHYTAAQHHRIRDRR